ncbi:MAG: polysaccharide biosynthesis/export family protein [Armatimonadota bacterium]
MRAALCCLTLAVILVMAPAGTARGQTPSEPAGAGLVNAPAPSPQPDSYRICPGDILFISVDGEQLLTRECQVNGAGTISYPLLGDVRAAGETCSSLTSGLTSGLGRYLKSPQVMVTVRQYGQVGMSVYVMGEVAKPGAYPLASGTGVMQPIAAAGGPTEFASGEITILDPAGGSRSYQLDQLTAAAGTAEAVLHPGDVILVNRKKETRYSVLGEVPAPGMFDMPGRGDVRILDAMARCGLLPQPSSTPAPSAPELVDNPTRMADLEHSVLTRGEERITVNLAALLQGDTTQNLVLQPGDVLTVPRRSGIRVYALGEVRTPGRQYLPERARVLDLVNTSGGMTSAARAGDSAVLRMVDGQPTSLPVDLGLLLSKGDAKQNIALQEGDVLYVPAKGAPNDSLWRLLYLVPRIVF